jgi:hypothetical protein
MEEEISTPWKRSKIMIFFAVFFVVLAVTVPLFGADSRDGQDRVR